MSLVKIYRYGPTRQRVKKGFVVTHPQRAVAGKIAQSLAAELAPGKYGVSIDWDRRHPTSLWLNAGLRTLHKPSERARLTKDLSDSLAFSIRSIERAGGRLLPNAIFPTSGQCRWQAFLCNDIHELEMVDAVEAEMASNLLRLLSPLFIAMSGRAGLNGAAVDWCGSRRLLVNGRGFATRWIASAAPEHLERVETQMRQQSTADRWDQLDIYPRLRDGSNGADVVVQCLDGQSRIQTTVAHALLLQAVAMRARQYSRFDQRVFPTEQKRLEWDRSAVIANGFRTNIFHDLPPGLFRFSKRGQRTKTPRVRPETSLLGLLYELCYEWQVLEAEVTELSPLVLGLEVRQLGRKAIINENDLLRTLVRRKESLTTDSALVTFCDSLLDDQGRDLMTKLNHEKHGAACRVIEAKWRDLLRTVVPDATASCPRLTNKKVLDAVLMRRRSPRSQGIGSGNTANARSRMGAKK